MYCLLSWVLTFGCIYIMFEEALFALSPAIPTFFLYANALEVLLTKVTLSLVISWWQVLPHAVNMLWMFIRPGLHTYESSFGLTIKVLILWLIIPWVIYFLALDFVSWTLQNLSSYYYRFLPSLNSTCSFIAYLLMLSNCMALFPKLFLYFLQGGGENIFIKLRLIVIYLTVVLIGWLLPPDITYLIAALTATTVLLEGLYYVYLLLKEYNSLVPPHHLIEESIID